MAWRAVRVCPTGSVGHATLRRPSEPVFPHDLGDGVHRLGHNAMSSFGAHSSAAPYASRRITGDEPVSIRSDVDAIPVPGHAKGSVLYLIDGRLLFTGDSLSCDPRHHRLSAFRRACWYSWDAETESLARLADLHRDVDRIFCGHGRSRERENRQPTQRYSIRRPEIARLITSCWICSVPSKMSWVLRTVQASQSGAVELRGLGYGVHLVQSDRHLHDAVHGAHEGHFCDGDSPTRDPPRPRHSAVAHLGHRPCPRSRLRMQRLGRKRRLDLSFAAWACRC